MQSELSKIQFLFYKGLYPEVLKIIGSRVFLPREISLMEIRAFCFQKTGDFEKALADWNAMIRFDTGKAFYYGDSGRRHRYSCYISGKWSVATGLLSCRSFD